MSETRQCVAARATIQGCYKNLSKTGERERQRERERERERERVKLSSFFFWGLTINNVFFFFGANNK